MDRSQTGGIELNLCCFPQLTGLIHHDEACKGARIPHTLVYRTEGGSGKGWRVFSADPANCKAMCPGPVAELQPPFLCLKELRESAGACLQNVILDKAGH